MAASLLRALVVDYDGTIALEGRPAPETLHALRWLRESGRLVLLATGRILRELTAEFPDVAEHFDAIVAENGAVLAHDGRVRALVPRVERALERALHERGVPVRCGEVLLATEARFADTAMVEIARLGLEAQLVRNRGALMILPPRVDKGSGVAAALEALGSSAHNAVAVGDAENDHSLLSACEIGVAVGNAVPALRAHADVVLPLADGAGIVGLCEEMRRDAFTPGTPMRWSVALGRRADGTEVRLPAMHTNLLIDGPSGQGKSYLAGLVAERLLELGYILLVLDLEGDHASLGGRHGVMAVSGAALPSPEQLGALLRRQAGALILDLSGRGEAERREYALRALREAYTAREDVGRPHWILVDEAHVPFAAGGAGCDLLPPRHSGLCLVTYRPGQLCPEALRQPHARLTADADGSAVLARAGDAEGERFVPDERSSPHVRHRHKYEAGQLPPARRFVFRTAAGTTGRSAGNIPEFARELSGAAAAALRHHAAHGDFSRWLGDLAQDDAFTRRLRDIERAVARDRSDEAVARARECLARALAERYAVGGAAR